MQKKEPLSVVSNGLLKILPLLVELLIPLQHFALRIRQLFQHMYGRIQSWLRTGFWPRRFPWLYGRVLVGLMQFMALILYFSLWFCPLVSLVHRSARWLPRSCSRSAVRQQAAVVRYEPIHKAVPLIPKTAYCAPHQLLIGTNDLVGPVLHGKRSSVFLYQLSGYTLLSWTICSHPSLSVHRLINRLFSDVLPLWKVFQKSLLNTLTA